MKKIFSLIALLLLAACGGGGGGTSTGSTVTVTPSTPTGILNVTFSEANAKLVAAFAPGQHFRVVVRNPGLIVDGNPFSAIQDADPTQTIGFALPVASGYTVEAIAYTTSSTTGLNMMSKYAIANHVTINKSGQSTDVTLPLAPITGSLILPTSIVQGAKYNIVQRSYSTILGRRVTPLDDNWYLCKPQISTFVPFVNRTSATTFGPSFFFDAPITGGVPTNLYFQAVFTAKRTLLKPGETQKMWVFNSAESSLPVTANTNVVITVPDPTNW